VGIPLQWDFFEYLPVVLQDAATKDVLMVQYMTEDGLRRTLEERSMWLWSRSREEFWMAGRQSNGYDLQALRANCMGTACSRSSTRRTGPSATSAAGAASRSPWRVLLEGDSDSISAQVCVRPSDNGQAVRRIEPVSMRRSVSVSRLMVRHAANLRWSPRVATWRR
jgi:phosphoribosyl-AMP cyclohydrolase